MSAEEQTGGGITGALKAGVNYLTGSSNTTAAGNSTMHQDGVDHIKNKLAEKEQDSSNFSRGERGEQTDLPSQVAESYRQAPDVAPQTTGSAEAIHDKREMQQELESMVAQPAPPTSEGVGRGTGSAGSGVTGTYSDSGVRGGGIGTTNQTGGVASTGTATTLHSAPGQYNQGVDFTGHRSAEEVAGNVAGISAESTRGVPSPKAGWHPDQDAAADGSYRRSKDASAPGFTTAGDSLTDRTRNDPALDGSGHSRGSDFTAGAAGLGAGAAGTAVIGNSRNDPAHDTSGTFTPQSGVGRTPRDDNQRQTYSSENRASALGAAAGGAGLAAGVAGTEASRDRDTISTTQKERTDPTDTATDKLRRDAGNSASDDAVLGSSAVGHQGNRGERGVSGSDLHTTESATDKLRRDPAHSASDDHVLGSDAHGQLRSRGEHVDSERHEEAKHNTPENAKDDPYWHGKESAREHLEHEARQGRTVKENPDSIPTAGGEKLGTKHWGESKKLPE